MKKVFIWSSGKARPIASASTMGRRAMEAGMMGSRELLPPISLEMRAVAFSPT